MMKKLEQPTANQRQAFEFKKSRSSIGTKGPVGVVHNVSVPLRRNTRDDGDDDANGTTFLTGYDGGDDADQIGKNAKRANLRRERARATALAPAGVKSVKNRCVTSSVKFDYYSVFIFYLYIP